MSVATDKYQVGNSATPSQNFVIKTSNDGTLTIARGIISAEIGDIVKINNDGSVTGPFLGSGQTWQDMLTPTVQRVVGTTYTNNTGKPIQVSVGYQNSGSAGTMRFKVGSTVISQGANNTNGVGVNWCVCAVIPVGATYVLELASGSQTNIFLGRAKIMEELNMVEVVENVEAPDAAPVAEEVTTGSGQKWYVNSEGVFMGSWVDATEEPPEGWIEVPFGPDIHADQIWDFDTQTWGPSLYATTAAEDAWCVGELAFIAEQLLMIEDDDPNALPGTAAQWRAYRVQVRAWKTGNVNFPYGTRPTRPE